MVSSMVDLASMLLCTYDARKHTGCSLCLTSTTLVTEDVKVEHGGVDRLLTKNRYQSSYFKMQYFHWSYQFSCYITYTKQFAAVSNLRNWFSKHPFLKT